MRLLFHICMILLTHGLWILVLAVLYLVRRNRNVPRNPYQHRGYW